MTNNESINIPKLEELITNDTSEKINDIDKITDKIYLGDEEAASKFENLKLLNIKNVLSITDSPPKYPDELQINHKSINFEDSISMNLIPYLKESIEFIENSDKIFIHCSCGVNRSPTIVIGYLMWKTHSTYKQAYNFVQKRRPCIEPSIGFIKQLKKFETLLKNNNYNYKNIDDKSINKK